MKKLLKCALLITLLSLQGCNDKQNEDSSSIEEVSSNSSSMTTSDDKKEDNMKITLSINNNDFSATIYDNSTAKAFLDVLPLDLKMTELNGNEKYIYLDKTFPTNTEKVSTINEGDIMLYGNNCLVIFYKSFKTSYSYSKIGKIDNPSNLAQIVGKDSINVKINQIN